MKHLPLSVKLTIAGMVMSMVGLIFKRALPFATSEEMLFWLVRFNWTFTLIGWGLIAYGAARIFSALR